MNKQHILKGCAVPEGLVFLATLTQR